MIDSVDISIYSNQNYIENKAASELDALILKNKVIEIYKQIRRRKTMNITGLNNKDELI